MALIHTQRFLLRPIAKTDAPALARLCNDALIARNTARIPHPYTLADAERFTAFAAARRAEGGEHIFAVCDGGQLIACCGVTVGGAVPFELGYWVGAHVRSKGVATEAGRAVACFTFEKLGADRIEAAHFTDNPASGRVLEKIGFCYSGVKRLQFSMGRAGEAESLCMTLARDAFASPEDAAFS